MPWLLYFAGFLSGLFLVSGLVSLFLFMRRIERGINLSYFFFAFFLASALTHSVLTYYSRTIEEMLYHDKLLNAALLVAGVSFLFLVSELTGYKPRAILMAMLVPLPFLFVWNILLPYGLSHDSIEGMRPITLVWGEQINSFSSTPGLPNRVVIAYMIVLLVFIVRAIIHQMREGDKRYSRLLLVLFSTGVFGLLVDNVLAEFDLPTLIIVDDVGYFGFVILIWHRNFANLFRSNDLIRASEERMARMAEATFEGIAVTENGMIVDANEQLARMLGYEPGALIGRAVVECVAPESREVVREKIALKSRDPYEHLALRSDGSVFPVEVRARQLTSDGRRRVSAIRDITERKRIESELIAQKQEADRSNKLKDAFIANISHEIRTPVNVIVGYTGLIGDAIGGALRSSQRQLFESVTRGAERLMRTVDEILSFSRLQIGDLRTKPENLDIGSVVAASAQDWRRQAEGKGLDLQCTNEAGQVFVRADEYCVSQILANLLDNAVKYTQRGSIQLRIFRVVDERITIEIKDTGIGIPADYLPHLFEPYTQAETGYSRRFEGIGLGLSLVKKYADLNGIEITVASAPGVGTAVQLVFPVFEAAELDLPDTSGEGKFGMASTAPAPDLAASTVLLVEDDALTVQYMSALLHGRCTMLSAQSAEAAHTILAHTPVDLVLMDISLSGEKTGLALVRELRDSEQHARLPIIALTAHVFPQDRDACMRAGCDAFLTKPALPKELFAAMTAVLRARART